jgi:hypothetical protein
MKMWRFRLLALAMVAVGLLWGQLLIASNEEAVCSKLAYVDQCLDQGCCLIPGQCETQCFFIVPAQECQCLERLPDLD